MDSVTAFLRGAGAARLATLIGVAAGLAIAFSLIMTRIGGQGEALLYGGLDPQDASRVTAQLDGAGIGYRLGGDGGAIYVSRGEVAQARLMLASEGALGSGSVGYEIFDESDALGTTQFVQNVQAKRATEGELARTIVSIRGVDDARVHLVLPERRLFQRESEEPTATVVVDIADPSRGPAHARTIANLVATAVPGLKPGRVTVVDEQGRTLANGAESGDDFSTIALNDQRANLEESLRQKALDAIQPIVGAGGARVQVAAEIDMNRVTQNDEIFDPEGQVEISRSTIEETSSEQDTDQQNTVTVANNLPDPQGAATDGPTSSASQERTEETVNYENSKTVRTEVKEAGAIERLSIAVAVDHARQVADDGTVTYAPRPQEELDRIAALARAAVGFDQDRGDVIEVTSLPFQRPDLGLGVAASDSGFLSGFGKNDIMRVAEIIVMLVIGLALVLMVARPLAKSLTAPLSTPALAGVGEGGQAALDSGGAQQGSLPKPPANPEDQIDIAQVDGKLSASSVKRISEIVDKHPDESLSIMRSWMNED